MQEQLCSKIATKRIRNSNIELLRIFSACAVIALHYNGIGHVFENSSGLSKELMAIIESISVCAVDCFIMISGYFLCMNNKRTWDKPLYLYLTLSIIVSLSYIVTCLLEGISINPITVVHSMIPPKNYFVLLYVTLYIISPYVNSLINTLSEYKFRTFIILTIMLFSVYPTLMDTYQNLINKEIMGVSTVGAWGQQHGYNIVNFTLCYCLGAYLRHSNTLKHLGPKKALSIVLFCVVAIYIWFKIENIVSQGSAQLVDMNALSYSNPFVLTLSFCLLALSLNVHFENKNINQLAKASFVCYLLNLVVLPKIRIEKYASMGGLLLFVHWLMTIIIIYIMSYVLWAIIDWIITPICSHLKKHHIFKID